MDLFILPVIVDHLLCMPSAVPGAGDTVMNSLPRVQYQMYPVMSCLRVIRAMG